MRTQAQADGPCACQERCLHEAILVVLVTASPAFPHKNHFVERLMERHPEITTIVQNINGKKTTMVYRGYSSRNALS